MKRNEGFGLMKALVYIGPQELEMHDKEIPEPRAAEAIIRVASVGICGSELEGYMGHSSVRTPPLVMGHEFCGIVDQLAPDVTGLHAGDKVVANPLIACGSCDRCRLGKPNLCRNRQIVGIHRPGAFAEYVAVPAANLYPVPASMDTDLASLAEPLAVCLHAVKIGLRPFQNLIIYGAGPIGLLTLQAAQAMGAQRVLVIEKQLERRAFAKQLGAETAAPDMTLEASRTLFGQHGVDTIIDCVGVQPTREQAMQLVNPGGTVVMVGLGQDLTKLPLNHLVRQEVAIIGSYTYSDEDFGQAVSLLTNGKISGGDWMTACHLPSAPAVFAALTEGRTKFSKYIIHPHGEGRQP